MVNVLSILDKIAATSSRKEKEKILFESGDMTFKTVLLMAYNPLINYYIKKIPQYEPADDPTYIAYSLPMALEQLKVLSDREKTGHDAIAFLKNLLEAVTPNDAIVLERVVLQDLRCGISDSTINKVWKGFIPETPYMRCSLLKDLKNVDWKKGLISQVKADGSFVYLNYNKDGTIELFTRNGRHYDVDSPDFNDIVETAKYNIPSGYQLHGELLVFDLANKRILPRQIGNGMLNSILKGGILEEGYEIRMQTWDMIPIENFTPKGKYDVVYTNRLIKLNDCVYGLKYISPIESNLVYSLEEALADYKDKLARGLEGTILKDPDSIWEDKTSKRMWKFKLEVTVDLQIIDFTEGNGKHADTFGSMTCVTSDGMLEVNVSGISDEERLQIHNNREEYRYKIMAVTANALMEPKKGGGKYSLFLPRCAEIREDKTTADTLQQVKDQFESVVKI